MMGKVVSTNDRYDSAVAFVVEVRINGFPAAGVICWECSFAAVLLRMVLVA